MTVTDLQPSRLDMYARATLRELIDKGSVTYARMWKSFNVQQHQINKIANRVVQLGNGAVRKERGKLVFDIDAPFEDSSRVPAAQEADRAKRRGEAWT